MSEPTLADYQRFNRMKNQKKRKKQTCVRCGGWFFGTMFENECPECVWNPFYEALEEKTVGIIGPEEYEKELNRRCPSWSKQTTMSETSSEEDELYTIHKLLLRCQKAFKAMRYIDKYHLLYGTDDSIEQIEADIAKELKNRNYFKRGDVMDKPVTAMEQEKMPELLGSVEELHKAAETVRRSAMSICKWLPVGAIQSKKNPPRRNRGLR